MLEIGSWKFEINSIRGDPQSEIQIQYIDGLVQDCSYPIANALELLQSCTKPSTYRSKGQAAGLQGDECLIFIQGQEIMY